MAVRHGQFPIRATGADSAIFTLAVDGDRLLVTLCPPEPIGDAAIGEVRGAHDWGDGVHCHAFGSQ